MDGQLNDLVGEWFGIDHRDEICVSSLDPERVTIDRFGNPSNEYPVIKIGGTNGKGSTTRFVGWSLIKEGYNVDIITRPQGTSRTDHESQLRSTQHKYIKDVDEAIETSLEIAESSDSVVCVTGSLYLMRTVRPILNLGV